MNNNLAKYIATEELCGDKDCPIPLGLSCKECPSNTGESNNRYRRNKVHITWEELSLRHCGVDLQTLKLNHTIGMYND
jgi:hypothetical protein